jgi:hypothetical protein
MIIRKLSTRLLIATFTFLIGISLSAWLLHSPKQEFRVSIPDSIWVHIWFELTGLETKSINEITREAELPNLRAAALPGDDLDVRVWVTAQQHSRAFILRRTTERWSAIVLRGMLTGQKLEKREILTAPRSGWEGAWARLVNAGILILPDAGEIQCTTGIFDGVAYVVELSKDRTYRTYIYDNPQYANCDDAKQMIKIAGIIQDEFGWEDNGKE